MLQEAESGRVRNISPPLGFDTRTVQPFRSESQYGLRYEH
jgi:hypothetical protein